MRAFVKFVETGWRKKGVAILDEPQPHEIRCGPCRDRTCDPLIKSQLLYQLS